MDVRDIIIDGVDQLHEWMDEALAPMTKDQLNWLPDGKTTSAGFSAWHVMRTQDNVINFVLQGKRPIWIEQGYLEKFGLPKVAQGTGMSLEEARAISINDPALLREYHDVVHESCIAFIKDFPLDQLEELQQIKPMGEMTKARILRQVIMTHGFMHLGEINLIRGMMGMQFSI